MSNLDTLTKPIINNVAIITTEAIGFLIIRAINFCMIYKYYSFLSFLFLSYKFFISNIKTAIINIFIIIFNIPSKCMKWKESICGLRAIRWNSGEQENKKNEDKIIENIFDMGNP